jgi:hypothetical protein
MSIPEVKKNLRERKFHTATVPDVILFLYRKGFITGETDPDISQVLERCQRPQGVVFPHRLTEF